MRVISEAQLKKIIRKEMRSFLKEQAEKDVDIRKLANMIDVEVDPAEATKVLNQVAQKLDKVLGEDDKGVGGDAYERIETLQQQIINKFGSNPQQTVLQKILSNSNLMNKLSRTVEKDTSLKQAIQKALKMADEGKREAAEKLLADHLRRWVIAEKGNIVDTIVTAMGLSFLGINAIIAGIISYTLSTTQQDIFVEIAYLIFEFMKKISPSMKSIETIPGMLTILFVIVMIIALIVSARIKRKIRKTYQ